MLLLKEGFPESDELVLCTVTKIFHNGVFVDLDEYAKGGMIHISEVSPGRIRNIRDFVVEGKKVVCKILRVDDVKGHIDLSLRRVNEGQKKLKINEIKSEQRAEKIIEFAAKKLNLDVKKLYFDIYNKISDKYLSVFLCFEDVVKGNIALEKLPLDKKTADILTELVKERMKPSIVFVGGNLKLKTYASDGVEIIKETLRKLSGGGIGIVYGGGGKYKIMAKAAEYKDAEKILDKSVSDTISFIEEKGGEGEFVKKE
ncbi:MAG: S1 RNA-binding domain-containing protein [Nanoarchaeota archaeon]|nr:S1 RNA-binding domain-containing protein [Nanoarchaeota archaeon]MBU1004531.1 S1 RNA-binding domain-containing protein [Nanoarchaeota archaeon]MBU1945932.1 S1 RNA-binding domain-containing protein [Nanoarchaeota archaeon]